MSNTDLSGELQPGKTRYVRRTLYGFKIAKALNKKEIQTILSISRGQIHNFKLSKHLSLHDLKQTFEGDNPSKLSVQGIKDTFSNPPKVRFGQRRHSLERSFKPFDILKTHPPQEKSPHNPKMPNHLKVRDVLGMIPLFTGLGTDSTFREFSLACIDAKNALPGESEVNLTSLIRSRLRDGALETFRNRAPKTIDELIQCLKVYAPPENSLILRTELTRLCQKPSETVAAYYSRTKTLENKIIELQKNENNNRITEEEKKSIKTSVCQAFVIGLKHELFSLMKEKEDLDKAGPEAISLEDLLKTQRALRDVELGNEKCVSCGEKGHEPRNCALLYAKSNSEKCQLCDRGGHSAKDCKPRNNNSNSPEKCQLCSEMGHSARDCIKNNHFNRSIKCRICNRFGHETRDCRNNSSRDVCQICQGLGHRADECRHYVSIHVAQSNTCQTCGLRNHTTSECRRNKPCPKCGKLGHLARDCRTMGNCQLCKQPGHIARTCPQISHQIKICQYCSREGHTAETCYRLRPPTNTTTSHYCSFCKSNGHSIETCRVRQAAFTPVSQGNDPPLPSREGQQQVSFIDNLTHTIQ